MQKLPLTALAVLLVTAGAPSTPDVAGAADAAVNTPRHHVITDHYGDPDRFVKYIIRRPPVLA